MKLIIRDKPLTADEAWKQRTQAFLALSPEERFNKALYMMWLSKIMAPQQKRRVAKMTIQKK
jgi:hypothetical protein